MSRARVPNCQTPLISMAGLIAIMALVVVALPGRFEQGATPAFASEELAV